MGKPGQRPRWGSRASRVSGMKREMGWGDEGWSRLAAGKGERCTCPGGDQAYGHGGLRSRQFAREQNAIG